MRFRRTRRGIEARLHPTEVAVLTRCLVDLLDLLGRPPEPSGDPLEALVGLPDPERAPAPPADPALARLLPAAYADDVAAAAEFRRFTEADLLAGKRAAATGMLSGLPPGGGAVLLDADAGQAWLGALNDLRLVLGTRLGVTEDTDYAAADPDRPEGQALHLYGWLSWVQESLLAVLQPR